MAATENVRQLSPSDNLLTPRHGVLTLFGYGIQVRVDRGHLLIEDGIGEDRRRMRLARVGHGLKRLVCIGADDSYRSQLYNGSPLRMPVLSCSNAMVQCLPPQAQCDRRTRNC